MIQISSILLKGHEKDARVVELLLVETSGFDYSDGVIIFDKLRSDDFDLWS